MTAICASEKEFYSKVPHAPTKLYRPRDSTHLSLSITTLISQECTISVSTTIVTNTEISDIF